MQVKLLRNSNLKAQSIMAAEKIIQIVNENNSNYTEIESKACGTYKDTHQAQKNLRNYLRRKVKDSHLSINSANYQ